MTISDDIYYYTLIDPENEIPPGPEEIGLMEYKRRGSKNERRNTSSPARSRPQPKHPVRSSPKQSPFIGRAVKNNLPSIAVSSIAVHSQSSSATRPSSKKEGTSESSAQKDLDSAPKIRQPSEPFPPQQQHLANHFHPKTDENMADVTSKTSSSESSGVI